jgi:hypothetical protein
MATSMRRLAAIGAFVFVVLNIVCFLLPGTPPDFSDPGTKVASFVQDNHKQLVIAVLLLFVAAVILVGVLAQLVQMARDAGRDDSAAAIGIASAAGVTLFTLGISLYATLTQIGVNGTDPGTIRTAYQLTQFIFMGLTWITLALVLAMTRAALNGVFARWSIWLNALIAIGLFLAGISIRGAGVLEAGTGAFAFIGFAATMVLFAEIGFLLWRSAPATEKARVAAPTPA